MRRSLLWLALLCHVALATGYLLRTPSFEAPDENSHYEFGWFIANAGELPLTPLHARERQLPPTAAAQLAHHPPLYYGMLAAMLIATGSADTVFAPQENPRFGDPAHPGRALTFQHGSGQGERTLHLLRALSVLLGAVTIVAVHRLSRRCYPEQPRVADLAAVLVACLPMFSFLHGALNNDVLATTLATLTMVVLVGISQRPKPTIGDGLRLGALLGAALLTKLTTLFLLPLAAAVLLACWWRTRRDGGAAATVRTTALALGLTAGISGFWFVRNWQLYGDPLALAAHDSGFTLLPPELRWGYFFGVDPWPAGVPSFLPMVFSSLLGRFGWFILPPPRWLPPLALALVGLALLGLLRRDPQRHRLRAPWLLLLAGALVLAATAHFNWTAPQPQGRLLFPAIGPGAVLLATGLVRISHGLPFRRWLLLLPPGVAIGILTLWFTPAFAPQLAPAPSWHRALVGGIVAPAGPTTIRWAADMPNEGSAPPVLRWTDQGAPPDTCYTLYAIDAADRVWLASQEWSKGAVALRGGETPMPANVFEFLPRDLPLRLRLRRVPNHPDEDPATLPVSPLLPFRRR